MQILVERHDSRRRRLEPRRAAAVIHADRHADPDGPDDAEGGLWC
jgi:hypothetical protein